MKNVLKLLLFSFVAFSGACQTQDDVSIDTLRTRVVNDPLYKEYNSLLDKEVELFATGELSFKNVDMNYIKLHKKDAETGEQLIQVYEKAGMKNAQKYLDISSGITLSFSKIVNKYYRLANMSGAERQVFMKSIAIPVKKLDLEETRGKRKKNLSNN